MKTEYLREFMLLSRYLNFNKTASSLYMTPSVLSRHISAMEEELGVQLLFRNTQSVALTEAGKRFLSGVEEILSKYDALVSEVLLMDQLYDNTLSLGLNYYAFNYYLGAIPQHFQLYYPRTKIFYQTGSPDQLIASLLNGELDAILVNHFPFPAASQLEFSDLFLEPYYVLLPDYHPLAKRVEVSVADLAGETFVGVDTNVFACSWDYLQSLFAAKGIEPPRPIFFKQLEEATVAVRQGTGLLIEGQNLRHLTNCYLVCLPLVGEGCQRMVSVAYKKGNANPAITQLLDSYSQQLAAGWNPSVS